MFRPAYSLTFAFAFMSFLGVASAQSTEALRGEIALLNPADVTLYGQAEDFNNPLNNTFQVQVCWDDPTFTRNCDRPVTANTIGYPYTTCQTCYGFNYTVPSATVGAVSPRDGKQHLMYLKAISQQNPGSGDQVLAGSPWPFAYRNNTVAPMWSPNLEATPKRLTASQIAVFANRQDKYSIGSTGTTVCTVSGVAIKNDGVVGYFVQNHKVPCSNVRVVSISVAPVISQSTFNSTIQPLLQGLPSTIQAVALGWAEPSIVTPSLPGFFVQSISAVVAHDGMVTGGVCYDSGTGLGPGPINPYFNTPSQTPFTDYGLRPTMLLAAEICPTCTATNNYGFPWTADINTAKSVINSAVRATDTNPLGGNVDWAWTGDLGRSITAVLASPLSMGSAMSPMVHAQVLGSLSAPTPATVSAQNILLYDQGSATWPYANPTFVSGAGIAFAVTSTSGFLPYDGNQTNTASWLNHGAIAAFGNAVEPCGLFPYKSPDPAVLIPNYTQGQTAIEALWKSVRMPWQGNFVGDPLASPFRLPAGTSTSPSLSSISTSSVLPGTSTKITFTGANFASPVTVNTGVSGITASSVTLVSSTTVTATITVASSTPAGTYNLSLTSGGKTTGTIPLTVTAGAPTLTGISPSSAAQSATVSITLTGTNFVSGASLVISGTGLTASSLTIASSTSITAQLGISSTAAAGNYTIAVKTAAGTSASKTFTVTTSTTTAQLPKILSLTPNAGTHGTTVPVTISGSNFDSSSVVTINTDALTIANVVIVNSSTITADFQIRSTAYPMAHSVIVTTTGGTSNPVSFTIH